MGRGGGNSSGKNSENSGSTSITITIPKTTSADANILGDLGSAQAKDFQYEIFYSTNSDGSSPSESKYAKEGKSVTFENVKYDTYTFFLKIWVSESRNALLDTFKVEKTVSASDHTVNFPDRSYSKYSNWYFVKTTEELTSAINEIRASTDYSSEKKAVICLMDIVEMSGWITAISSISEKCTLEKNGFKIVEKRFEVTVSSSITGGTVTAIPTGGEAGDTITLTVKPDEHYELVSISYSYGSTTGEPTLEEATGKYTFNMPASDVTVNAEFKLVIPEFKITLTAPDGIRTTTAGSDTVYLVTDSDLTDTTKKFTLTVSPVNSADSIPDGTKFSWGFNSETSYTTASSENPKEVTIGEMCGGITSAPLGATEYTIYCKASLEGGKAPEEPAQISVNLKGGLIGSKSAPDAVGDIVFNDGSAKPSTTSSLTDSQKDAAIAVIFDATNKLGVGLVQGTSLAWAIAGANGQSKTITTITVSKTNGSNASNAIFSDEASGSGNWNKLKSFLADPANGTSDDTGTPGNYPAWEWVNNYADSDKGNITAEPYNTGWYMPSIKELCDLYKAKDTVNTSIGNAGGTQMSDSTFSDGYYWSSSQYAGLETNARIVCFGNGNIVENSKNSARSVCAVRKFE